MKRRRTHEVIRLGFCSRIYLGQQCYSHIAYTSMTSSSSACGCQSTAPPSGRQAPNVQMALRPPRGQRLGNVVTTRWQWKAPAPGDRADEDEAWWLRNGLIVFAPLARFVKQIKRASLVALTLVIARINCWWGIERDVHHATSSSSSSRVSWVS